MAILYRDEKKLGKWDECPTQHQRCCPKRAKNKLLRPISPTPSSPTQNDTIISKSHLFFSLLTNKHHAHSPHYKLFSSYHPICFAKSSAELYSLCTHIKHLFNINSVIIAVKFLSPLGYSRLLNLGAIEQVSWCATDVAKFSDTYNSDFHGLVRFCGVHMSQFGLNKSALFSYLD